MDICTTVLDVNANLSWLMTAPEECRLHISADTPYFARKLKKEAAPTDINVSIQKAIRGPESKRLQRQSRPPPFSQSDRGLIHKYRRNSSSLYHLSSLIRPHT